MIFLKYSIIFSTLVIFVYGGAHLVKRDKGYYITGRGCGLLTPLKYMKEVPENLDDNTCSFIPFKDKVDFYCDGCMRGKNNRATGM